MVRQWWCGMLKHMPTGPRGLPNASMARCSHAGSGGVGCMTGPRGGRVEPCGGGSVGVSHYTFGLGFYSLVALPSLDQS